MPARAIPAAPVRQRPAPVLTDRQVERIQASFGDLEPDLDFFVQVFYARLFAASPHLKYLFRGDQATQEQQFARMLTGMVNGLRRLDRIKPALWALGRRHVTYGVRPQDYETFFDSLNWTLAIFLGEKFSPYDRQAWATFFGFMAGIMQNKLDWHQAAEPPGVDAA